MKLKNGACPCAQETVSSYALDKGGGRVFDAAYTYACKGSCFDGKTTKTTTKADCKSPKTWRALTTGTCKGNSEHTFAGDSEHACANRGGGICSVQLDVTGTEGEGGG